MPLSWPHKMSRSSRRAIPATRTPYTEALGGESARGVLGTGSDQKTPDLGRGTGGTRASGLRAK